MPTAYVLDQIITLKGRTKYGREQIESHGSKWKIIAAVRDVRVALESGDYLMWINVNDDPNYEIVEAS